MCININLYKIFLFLHLIIYQNIFSFCFVLRFWCASCIEYLHSLSSGTFPIVSFIFHPFLCFYLSYFGFTGIVGSHLQRWRLLGKRRQTTTSYRYFSMSLLQWQCVCEGGREWMRFCACVPEGTFCQNPKTPWSHFNWDQLTRTSLSVTSHFPCCFERTCMYSEWKRQLALLNMAGNGRRVTSEINCACY